MVYKDFIGIYKRELAVWLISLVVISLTCNLLLNIDSMIRFSSITNICVDYSIFYIVSYIIAIFLALLTSGIASSFLIFNRYKTANILTAVSNIAAGAIAAQFIFRLLKLWLANLLSLSGIFVALQYKIGIMFIVVILLIKYKHAINNRINNEIVTAIRVSTILLLICFTVIGVRIVSTWKYTDNSGHLAPKTVDNHPNVILISFDALTAEDMSLYGYLIDTTPNISKLAEDSYVFENMYSNGNWTKPSVASILTGTYPSSHGLISASPFNLFAKKGRKDTNLPGYLKMNGFDTSAIVSNIHFAHPVLNDIHTSFNYRPLDTIDEHYVANYWRSRKLLKIAPYFMAINSSAIQWIMMTIDHYPLLKRSFTSFFIKDKWETQTYFPAEMTFSLAEKYLTSVSSTKFMWVHVMPPHYPYLPPKPFRYSLLSEKGLDTFTAQDALIQKAFYSTDEQKKVDMLRLRYDESIRYADYEFGKFLDYLKRSGYYDNSIIIITADHGESFNKNYLSHAGPWSYQQLIHIPLIVHLPMQLNGKRVKCNAEHVDLAPTIIDLLGLKDPGWFDGESLKKAMSGEYVTDKPKYSMNLQMNMPGKIGVLQSRSIAVILKQYKYIYYIDKDYGELFNIITDPKELHNLVNSEQKIAERLKALIPREVFNK